MVIPESNSGAILITSRKESSSRLHTGLVANTQLYRWLVGVRWGSGQAGQNLCSSGHPYGLSNGTRHWHTFRSRGGQSGLPAEMAVL
jgi:hypothetical protein